MSRATFTELFRRKLARTTTSCAPDLPERTPAVRILPKPAFDWEEYPDLAGDDR